MKHEPATDSSPRVPVMEPLPPIPTPLSQYWREFRVRILPVLVFGLVTAAAVVIWRQAGISGYLAGVAEGVRSTVTSPQMGILQQLNVRPYQVVQVGDPIAVVMPRDPANPAVTLALTPSRTSSPSV